MPSARASRPAPATATDLAGLPTFSRDVPREVLVLPAVTQWGDLRPAFAARGWGLWDGDRVLLSAGLVTMLPAGRAPIPGMPVDGPAIVTVRTDPALAQYSWYDARPVVERKDGTPAAPLDLPRTLDDAAARWAAFRAAEDAAFLAARFYEEEPGPHRHAVVGVAPAALAVLGAHPWPGNVRELRNVVYQALLHKRGGDELMVADLPARLLGSGATRAAWLDRPAMSRALDSGGFNLRAAATEFERVALELALARGGTAAGAARLLGEVGRGRARDPGATVRAMMRRLKVTGPTR